MSITSAELAKIALNSYITMKISFTNQLRLIAESLPEADIRDILDAVGSDGSAKHLRPGLSYGGPCFRGTIGSLPTPPGKSDWRRRWRSRRTESTS